MKLPRCTVSKFPKEPGELRGDYLKRIKHLNNSTTRMNETEYPSLAARRRLYAEIVNEHYKKKKAQAKAKAWLEQQNKSTRRTGK